MIFKFSVNNNNNLELIIVNKEGSVKIHNLTAVENKKTHQLITYRYDKKRTGTYTPPDITSPNVTQITVPGSYITSTKDIKLNDITKPPMKPGRPEFLIIFRAFFL